MAATKFTAERKSMPRRFSVALCAVSSLLVTLSASRPAYAQACTPGTPVAIPGSLDATDSTLQARLPRNVAGGDAICPTPITRNVTAASFNDTAPHLYDVYHFVNPGTAGCFTFSLNWTITNPALFAAAYTAFDPTNIKANYIADINRAPGNALTPAQVNPPFSMGITIAAGASIDVVVSAVSTGSGASGAYTLSYDCALTETASAIGLALSSTNGNVTPGTSVTFTARLTGNSGGPIPTGTVTFEDSASATVPPPTAPAALAAPVTIDGTGVATFTTTTLALGTHNIFAVYSGDGTYPARTSVFVQFIKVNPTTVLTSSQNPQLVGNQVKFTATVTPPATPAGLPAPTGTVSFFVDGSTTAIGTGTLQSNGSGAFAASFTTTTALAVGAHSVTATMAGDTIYNTSNAAALTQTISKGSSTATVTSSQNPQAVGAAVIFSATVAAVAPAVGAPTGTVTFLDGATSLGTGTIAAGVATLSTAALAVGSHSVTATYAGDTNFVTSTSAALAQVINLNGSATTLLSSQSPQDADAPVTFTATVTAVAPAGGTPSGTVTFLDGAATIGSGTLAGGVATLTTAALAAGSHSITASYGGDASFGVSTSTAVTQLINVLVSATTLVSSANPQAIGGIVTFTATVAGADLPTGMVEFFDGSTVFAAGVLVGGAASVSTTTLAIGDHAITAQYDGDATFAPSASIALTQTIAKATSTVTLVATPNPSVADQPVLLTATVQAADGGVPTGTVTFNDGTTALGSGTITAGVATLTASELALGTHAITAVYAGDADHTGASGGTSQVVNAVSTATALASSANPSVFGQPITLTATVTGIGGGAGEIAAGSVTFRDGSTTLGSGPVTLDGAGVATIAVSSLTVGAHTLTAQYAPGPAKFTGSASSAVTQTVGPAATSTVVASSASSVMAGAPLTFTATVFATAPGAGTPSGMVTFSVDGSSVGIGTLNSGGQATLTITSLAVGGHDVIATYGGDGNFAASASPPIVQAVGLLLSSVVLTSAPNPQTVGGSVTFTATVSGSGTPTGSVSFYDGGATLLGSATLSAAGQAVFSTSDLTVGNHSITASYGGDTNFIASTSAPALAQVISQASVTVTLVSPGTSNLGDAVLFNVTVSSAAGGTPSGTVTFTDAGTTLGTTTLGSAGTGTFTDAALGAGPHTITAVYGGDVNHAGGSGTAMQVVSPFATATALTSSVHPSVFGQATTLTATVTATGATPTGSVVFKDGTLSLGTGPVQLSATGVATLSVSGLTAGSHTLTAEYTGPSKFSPSVSPAAIQVVAQAATTTVVATSSSAAVPGAPVTFIAAVSVTMPGAGTPTGNVTFSDGATVLGTVALANGFVSLSTSTLDLGSHAVTATYVGDTNFTGSSSAALTEVVSRTAGMATLAAVPSASTYGQDVTFTATLSAVSGGATPTGSVSFTDGSTTLGTGTLDGSGAATLAVHTLGAGSHTITATYGGDTLNAGGSTASVSLIVSPRATATALGSAPSASTVGESVTLTATTTASATPPLGGGGSGLVALAGTVTFKDGTTTIGAATLGADGIAVLMIDALAAGTHTLTATYEGADNYVSSASAPLTQEVSAATGDGGTSDGGAPDGSATDGSPTIDGAAPDAAPVDGSAPDGAVADAAHDGAADTGGAGRDGATDAAGGDGGPKAGGGGGGCGCQVGGQDLSSGALLGGCGLALALARRRRRSSSRRS
jgi:MYXO-CTERM domain-containing protein